MTVQPQKEKRLLLFAPLSRKCTLKSTVLEIGPEVAEEELKLSGFGGDISEGYICCPSGEFFLRLLSCSTEGVQHEKYLKITCFFYLYYFILSFSVLHNMFMFNVIIWL